MVFINNIKKITLSLLLAIMSAHCSAQYSAVSFYVVANQDQWQLFMGTNAYHDIVPRPGDSTKVVFIYTTIGAEGGSESGPGAPHYIARQQGAHNCIEFCADKNGGHTALNYTHVVVQGHTILKYSYKNVASYCLRLPGGDYGRAQAQQNLQGLQDSLIPTLTTVDSTATYTGWGDLSVTLQEILLNESAGISSITLNTADTDTVANQGDLPDNICSGRLCLDASDSLQHITINLFTEYAIAGLPVNLDDKAIANKAALLSQLDYVRTENGLPTEWTPQNIALLSRCYYKTIKK